MEMQIKTTMRCHFIPTRKAGIKKSIMIIGEDVKKSEPLCTADGILNVAAALKQSNSSSNN